MDKESLIKARDEIINLMSNIDINEFDKWELMRNLNWLLDPELYEFSINLLSSQNTEVKKIKKIGIYHEYKSKNEL